MHMICMYMFDHDFANEMYFVCIHCYDGSAIMGLEGHLPLTREQTVEIS